MKKYLFKPIPFFFILFIFHFSCQQQEPQEIKEVKHKAPVISIPKELEGDELITKHLFELSENLDAFALIMENIADEFEAMDINVSEEPSLRQKLRVTRVILPQIQPVMEIISNIHELDKTSQAIKDTLSEEKLMAYKDYEKAYNDKFEKLNKRFESFLAE